jgi:hypothetical protein
MASSTVPTRTQLYNCKPNTNEIHGFLVCHQYKKGKLDTFYQSAVKLSTNAVTNTSRTPRTNLLENIMSCFDKMNIAAYILYVITVIVLFMLEKLNNSDFIFMIILNLAIFTVINYKNKLELEVDASFIRYVILIFFLHATVLVITIPSYTQKLVDTPTFQDIQIETITTVDEAHFTSKILQKEVIVEAPHVEEEYEDFEVNVPQKEVIVEAPHVEEKYEDFEVNVPQEEVIVEAPHVEEEYEDFEVNVPQEEVIVEAPHVEEKYEDFDFDVNFYLSFEKSIMEEHYDVFEMYATADDVTVEEFTADDVTVEEFTADDVTVEEFTADDVTVEEFTIDDVTVEEIEQQVVQPLLTEEVTTQQTHVFESDSSVAKKEKSIDEMLNEFLNL